MKTITIPNNILIPEIKRTIDSGLTATFRVKGYSMRLFLENNRDKVILAPVRNALSINDVVLAEIGKDIYVLHRIIDIEGNTITLMGDGNCIGTEKCTKENVIGIATGFYRKGRSKPDMVNGFKWKIYTRIWLALKPLRRIILGIYRRIPINI